MSKEEERKSKVPGKALAIDRPTHLRVAVKEGMKTQKTSEEKERSRRKKKSMRYSYLKGRSEREGHFGAKRRGENNLSTQIAKTRNQHQAQSKNHLAARENPFIKGRRREKNPSKSQIAKPSKRTIEKR